MIERANKTIVVYETSYGLTLSELAEHLKDIPKECMDSVNISVDAREDPYYNSSTGYITITYRRLETDEEFEKRKLRIEQEMEARKQRELTLLRNLTEKYKGEL